MKCGRTGKNLSLQSSRMIELKHQEDSKLLGCFRHKKYLSAKKEESSKEHEEIVQTKFIQHSFLDIW